MTRRFLWNLAVVGIVVSCSEPPSRDSGSGGGCSGAECRELTDQEKNLFNEIKNEADSKEPGQEGQTGNNNSNSDDVSQNIQNTDSVLDPAAVATNFILCAGRLWQFSWEERGLPPYLSTFARVMEQVDSVSVVDAYDRTNLFIKDRSGGLHYLTEAGGQLTTSKRIMPEADVSEWNSRTSSWLKEYVVGFHPDSDKEGEEAQRFELIFRKKKTWMWFWPSGHEYFSFFYTPATDAFSERGASGDRSELSQQLETRFPQMQRQLESSRQIVRSYSHEDSGQVSTHFRSEDYKWRTRPDDAEGGIIEYVEERMCR